MAIFEAIEHLLNTGFVPRKTVYVVLAHDEEIRGVGAKRIAELLASRGVRAELVLDEGLLITSGIVPGTTKPVALVGTAEKGFLSIELSVESDAHHVAMPPAHTAAGRLAAAVTALEQSPLASRLEGAPRELYGWLGAEMSLGMRLVAANLWLFDPLVRANMTKNPATNALIRSTTAATMLEGSPRQNVMPKHARAVVVFFVRPGESTEDVLVHARGVVGTDVRTRVLEANEPTPQSPSTAAPFRMLTRTIRETFPTAVVAPSLLVGNVDARHFVGISSNIYRFTPLVADASDVKRIHGTDERISLEAYADVIRFYHRLIRNADEPALSP
jgi:carboxypeptidase PM20D1